MASKKSERVPQGKVFVKKGGMSEKAESSSVEGVGNTPGGQRVTQPIEKREPKGDKVVGPLPSPNPLLQTRKNSGPPESTSMEIEGEVYENIVDQAVVANIGPGYEECLTNRQVAPPGAHEPGGRLGPNLTKPPDPFSISQFQGLSDVKAEIHGQELEARHVVQGAAYHASQ